MLKRLTIIAAVTMLALPVLAQSAHNVVLAWTASPDTGVTYNLYRASGACPASGAPSAASEIANGLTALTYQDNAVTVGNTYCYYVTASLNSLESLPSNNGNAVILPGAPSALTVTVK